MLLRAVFESGFLGTGILSSAFKMTTDVPRCVELWTTISGVGCVVGSIDF